MKNVLIAIAALTASPVSAEVIDFDSLGFPGGAEVQPLTFASFVLGDYRFTALDPQRAPLVIRAQQDINNADPGGATLGLNTYGDMPGFEFSRIDGAAFDFTGFQATHFNNSTTSEGNGGTLQIYFDGVIGFNGSYDRNPGLQDYVLAGIDVRSVRISSNNLLQVDNLVVSSAVPEPSTWLMLIAGFAAVALRLRVGGVRARRGPVRTRVRRSSTSPAWA